MKILAFSGSNSKSSINKELIEYSVKFLNVPCDIIDLSEYDIPMYSIDNEKQNGIPSELESIFKVFITYDAYIIAIPEHNGNYPAFFKNILDWFSRIERGFFLKKPILLLNAAPGPNGGNSVLKIAEQSFPFFNGIVIAKFILASFESHKAEGEINIRQKDIVKTFNETIHKFEQTLMFQ